MDIKYNWVIDNPYLRSAIDAVAVAAWFWLAFGCSARSIPGRAI